MNPLSIYQQALDAVSGAVMASDFDAHAAKIDLPHLIHTAKADLLVSSAADLRPAFDALSQGPMARGVTRPERVARSADHVARDRSDGWRHAHVRADGAPLLATVKAKP